MKVIIDEKFYSWNGHREITFPGVLRRLWVYTNDYGENVGVSCGWSEETQKLYQDLYNDRILPLLPNGKAMRLYNKDDFVKVIKDLKVKYESEPSTNDHYERLIKVVCKVAYEQLGIPNCWVDVDKDDVKETKKARWLIQRSFTKVQEFSVCKNLMKTPEEVRGEDIGLLLMMFCSCRNGEAAGLNWKNLLQSEEYPDVYSIVINKKTQKNSNKTEARLKTPNGYRKNPLVDVFRDFLLRYKVYIETLIESGELVLPEGKTIDDLPIAHKGNDFLRRCSAADLSIAGKELFTELGFRWDKLQMVHNEELSLLGNATNDEPIEKDPTTYIMRRHFCTRLVGLGFTEAEIDFCMGHSMEGYRETRDMFFNDDLQYGIYLKLKEHPLNKRREELLDCFFTEK